MSSPGGPSESESVDGGVMVPEPRVRSPLRGRGEVGFNEAGASSSEGRRSRGIGGRVLGEDVPEDGTGLRVRPCGFEVLRFDSGWAYALSSAFVAVEAETFCVVENASFRLLPAGFTRCGGGGGGGPLLELALGDVGDCFSSSVLRTSGAEMLYGLLLLSKDVRDVVRGSYDAIPAAAA